MRLDETNIISQYKHKTQTMKKIRLRRDFNNLPKKENYILWVKENYPEYINNIAKYGNIEEALTKRWERECRGNLKFTKLPFASQTPIIWSLREIYIGRNHADVVQNGIIINTVRYLEIPTVIEIVKNLLKED